jgi:hypothetical protein
MAHDQRTSRLAGTSERGKFRSPRRLFCHISSSSLSTELKSQSTCDTSPIWSHLSTRMRTALLVAVLERSLNLTRVLAQPSSQRLIVSGRKVVHAVLARLDRRLSTRRNLSRLIVGGRKVVHAVAHILAVQRGPHGLLARKPARVVVHKGERMLVKAAVALTLLAAPAHRVPENVVAGNNRLNRPVHVAANAHDNRRPISVVTMR